MDKRGQFYLIIVFILSLVIYGVTYKVNSITEPIIWEDFNDVSQNYLSESVFVVNSALENKQDVNSRIENFTKKYLNHSKQRNPNLGLFYIYSNGTQISLKSYLDVSGEVDNTTILGANQELVQDVSIRIGGRDFIYKVPVTSENFGEGWSGVTTNNQPFNLSLAGVIHPFSLDPNSPEFRVIIRTASGSQNVSYGDPNLGWDPQLSSNVQQVVN